MFCISRELTFANEWMQNISWELTFANEGIRNISRELTFASPENLIYFAGNIFRDRRNLTYLLFEKSIQLFVCTSLYLASWFIPAINFLKSNWKRGRQLPILNFFSRELTFANEWIRKISRELTFANEWVQNISRNKLSRKWPKFAKFAKVPSRESFWL